MFTDDIFECQCDKKEAYELLDNVLTVTEQKIVKPYLEKLKKKIHAKSFESGLMNPILTYAEIMYMIDNLLSEDGEEE
jgi:hypothetical protein